MGRRAEGAGNGTNILSFLVFFLFFLLQFYIQRWIHWFSNVQLLLMSCQRWCSCKPFLQFIPVPQTSHWALIIMSNFPLRKIFLSPYVPWSVGLDVIRVYCTDPLWEKRLRAVDPLIHPRIWPITSSSSSSSFLRSSGIVGPIYRSSGYL